MRQEGRLAASISVSSEQDSLRTVVLFPKSREVVSVVPNLLVKKRNLREVTCPRPRSEWAWSWFSNLTLSPVRCQMNSHQVGKYLSSKMALPRTCVLTQNSHRMTVSSKFQMSPGKREDQDTHTGTSGPRTSHPLPGVSLLSSRDDAPRFPRPRGSSFLLSYFFFRNGGKIHITQN